MKKQNIVIISLGVIILALVALALPGVAWASSGCQKGPNNLCLTSPCDSSHDCSKICLVDTTYGFGACIYNGKSEDHCSESTATLAVHIYYTTCVDNVCVYFGFYNSTANYSPYSHDDPPCSG